MPKNKIIINETVEVFEHSGYVFQKLREKDFIRNEDIIQSLCPENN